MAAKATSTEDLLSTVLQDDHVFVSGWPRASPLLPPCSFIGPQHTNALCVTGLRPNRCTAPNDRSSSGRQTLSRRTSMRGTTRTVTMLAGISTVALLAAACGGGNGGNEPSA